MHVGQKFDGGSLHSDDGPDSIVIYGDLALNGHALRMKAETITIADGVTVSTSKITGQAGNITLDGQIKGRDVTILATADNRQVSGATGLAGDVANIAGNVLEGLLTFEATLAYEQVKPKIDIQTGSTIAARDFTAYASSYGKIQAAPLASILGGFTVGIIVSDATGRRRAGRQGLCWRHGRGPRQPHRRRRRGHVVRVPGHDAAGHYLGHRRLQRRDAVGGHQPGGSAMSWRPPTG